MYGPKSKPTLAPKATKAEKKEFASRKDMRFTTLDHKNPLTGRTNLQLMRDEKKETKLKHYH